MEQYARAVGDYDRALNLAPGMATALYGRGVARLRMADQNGRHDIEAATATDRGVEREMVRRHITLISTSTR